MSTEDVNTLSHPNLQRRSMGYKGCPEESLMHFSSGDHGKISLRSCYYDKYGKEYQILKKASASWQGFSESLRSLSA